VGRKDTKIITLTERPILSSQYKSDYDLLEKASTSAGPSRATRRAHIERVQNITAPLLPSTTSRVHTELELPLSAKSKGKQKAVDSANGAAPIESITPKKPGKSKPVSQPPKIRALAPILPVDSEASISVGLVRGKKRNIAVASPTGSPAAPPSAKKKRKFQEGLASEVAEIPNVAQKSTGPDDIMLDPSHISARRKSLVSVDYLFAACSLKYLPAASSSYDTRTNTFPTSQ
jgi:helicase SWR1